MNNNSLLLGVDIGTSACKAAVFTQDGSVKASADREYNTYLPESGYAEQDCNEWWDAVCSVLKECMSKIDHNFKIACIGVDGQSWSCIPVDKNGNVLCRTPIWMDMRATDICDKAEAEIGKEALFNVSKNPFKPSYTTPKIMWLKEHNKNIYNETEFFLQSNSYIVYRLTGVISQDRSQCYGLHVYDIEKGCYDKSLCDTLQIDINKLPRIYECDEIVGNVTKEASEMTGIPEGTPVVAGGLDAACGALGAGVYEPGQTQEQGGQAGGMSVCIDNATGDSRLILSNHVVPGKWLLQGGTVAGGASYKWIGETIGEYEFLKGNKNGQSPWKIMDDMASQINPGSDGLIFLPYLSGERSPIWDSKASGMFFGLSFEKTRGHMYRAVLEGVSYALRHNLDTVKSIGITINSLNAIGGSSKSDIWMQIKADVTGIAINEPETESATALGAAILAGIGVGIYKNYEDAVSKTFRIKKRFIPNPDNKRIYDEYYKIYRDLYRNTKGIMEKQNNILVSLNMKKSNT